MLWTQGEPELLVNETALVSQQKRRRMSVTSSCGLSYRLRIRCDPFLLIDVGFYGGQVARHEAAGLRLGILSGCCVIGKRACTLFVRR